MSRKFEDFEPKYAPMIFAIDPAFSFYSTGCGYAFLNINTECNSKALFHRTGIIQPFSNESSLGNMLELASKLKRVWEETVGFSSQPRAVVIERPIIYPGSNVKFSSITDLNILTGIFVSTFNPGAILVPCPAEWKGNKPKETTKDEVITLCNRYSLKNIERDLGEIAPHKRHNAFDAMGIGIYGMKVLKGDKPLPRLHFPIQTRFERQNVAKCG
jgi:hypothetical protein